MAVLSEMLRFKHHTTARGSTVEKPFLVDLALALGLSAPARMTKYEILDGAHALLFAGQPMPQRCKTTGSTVTDEALQRLINGVVAQGFAKVSLTDGGGAARIAVALSEAPATAEDLDWGDPFDPLALEDERKQALRLVNARSGQSAFRSAVLAAYEGRCAVSGCSVPEALDAAHIRPYRGTRTNVVPNGICLRADLHRLWDTGRLAVDESTHMVLLDADLLLSDYCDFLGRQIRLPRVAKNHPSSLALEQQRRWCGL
jgi:hypothetical protein